jgi:hypothetical protein
VNTDCGGARNAGQRVQAADQQAPALDLRVPRCGALFLVLADTARLNPYRRTADGEELMPYQENVRFVAGEHPVVEHQPDREAGVSGRIRTLPRRSSPEPFLTG